MQLQFGVISMFILLLYIVLCTVQCAQYIYVSISLELMLTVDLFLASFKLPNFYEISHFHCYLNVYLIYFVISCTMHIPVRKCIAVEWNSKLSNSNFKIHDFHFTKVHKLKLHKKKKPRTLEFITKNKPNNDTNSFLYVPMCSVHDILLQ